MRAGFGKFIVSFTQNIARVFSATLAISAGIFAVFFPGILQSQKSAAEDVSQTWINTAYADTPEGSGLNCLYNSTYYTMYDMGGIGG